MNLARARRSGRSAAFSLALATLAAGALDGAAFAQNPLVRSHDRQDHAFAGSFVGDGVRIELRWNTQTRAYTGMLESDGERYPCTAEVKGFELSGSFTAGGERYRFTALVSGDDFELNSDGVTRLLRRESTKPAQLPTGSGARPSATGRGGAGIRLGANAKGEVFVSDVAPGGAAARAGLRPGGRLRAVDGKRIDGMSLEQVGGMIIGPIGARVTLSIDSGDGAFDVVIERAPLGMAPEVGDSTRPAQFAAADLPELLKPGARITWYLGSATLQGVHSQLMPDDDGNWVDPATGRTYSEVDNPGAAGAGYLQFDISAADADGIAGDARNLAIIDPQAGRLATSSSQAMVGDAQALGDFWVHPAKLAAMKQVNTPGHRVLRMRYPLGGREFDAIAIETGGPQGCSRHTYDLASGLLIAGSTSSTGADVATVNRDGQVTGGAGSTTITSSRLVDVRQRRMPWGGANMLGGCRGGEQFHYAGTLTTVIPGVPEFPLQYSMRAQVQSAQRGFLLCKTRTSVVSNFAPPQEGEAMRIFGSGTMCPLFAPPQVLRELRPEQVLDEDPLTHYRITFAGAQDGRAMIVEQGPIERTQFVYDLESGVLTSLSMQQDLGNATTVVRIELQGRR